MQINNAIIAQYAQPFCYQFPESVLHLDAIPRIWIRYPLPLEAAFTTTVTRVLIFRSRISVESYDIICKCSCSASAIQWTAADVLQNFGFIGVAEHVHNVWNPFDKPFDGGQIKYYTYYVCAEFDV